MLKSVPSAYYGSRAGGGRTVEYFWVDGSAYPAEVPTLAEMTIAALDILEADKDSLFINV